MQLYRCNWNDLALMYIVGYSAINAMATREIGFDSTSDATKQWFKEMIG